MSVPIRTCKRCGKKLNASNRHDECWDCRYRPGKKGSPERQKPKCRQCGKKLGKASVHKDGLCGVCYQKQLTKSAGEGLSAGTVALTRSEAEAAARYKEQYGNAGKGIDAYIAEDRANRQAGKPHVSYGMAMALRAARIREEKNK